MSTIQTLTECEQSPSIKPYVCQPSISNMHGSVSVNESKDMNFS